MVNLKTNAFLWTLSLGLASCSSTNFASASKGTATNPASGATATTAGTTPNATDANQAGNGASTDGAAAGAKVSSAVASGTSGTQCLGTNAKLYNLVLSIDTSGSQAQTDPTNLRISGAKAFLQNLATFADANPNVTINVSDLAFSTNTAVGAHSWQQISSKTLATVDADIDAITATLQQGTYYLGALTAADQLFTTIKATPDASQRNFVLFMTDGEPNGFETTQQIISSVQSLTTKYGVAMINLGTGTEVTQAGDQILMSMALPTTGTVAADHVGKFIAVSTQDQMATIGSILTAAVSGCASGTATTTTTGTGSGT